MKRVLSAELPKLNKLIEIDPLEAKHLVTVLRAHGDEVIELLNGAGQKTRAKLVFQGKRVLAEGISEIEQNPKLNALPIHLKMAILKGDAMEWVIEKAVELGVQTLTPVITDYTVVQIQKKGADAFVERWQKIADQALKQCGRLERMKIDTPTKLEELFIQKNGTTLWLDETLAANGTHHEHLNEVPLIENLMPVSLLVGPEGGFSPHERDRLTRLQLQRFHLGAIILRAETAALMGMALLAGKLYGKRNT